jgi:hypothetical protein
MRPRTEKSVRGGSEIVAFNLNPPGFRPFGSKLAVQGRYNQNPFHRVLSGSLQGIAMRPLPCNYYVIQ